jgi:hypothetical protein
VFKIVFTAVVGVTVFTAPTAHAAPSIGDSCVNWHATTQDAKGQTLVCTHLADSGHMMYWESSIQDRSYRTSGFKTEPNNDWYGFGSGRPCNSNDVWVDHISPAGNAIERWGPKGCDPSLPMTGSN